MQTLAQFDQQIQQLEQQLQALRIQRDRLNSDIVAANSQRPPGIPPTWKPRFDGSGPSLRVFGWFDPSKLGD
jgi:hypothetical protein